MVPAIPSENAAGIAAAEPFWRRMADLSLSALGLVLLFPLLAFMALALFIADGRPVLFWQERVGKGGAPFRIAKFRTMRTRRTPDSLITVDEDDRVTPLGRWLRRLKIDELPQLWNVVRGEMSLIGPRPEVPKFVDLMHPLWREVLSVRPGITDLASILYKDEAESLRGVADPEAHYREWILPKKLEWNRQYMRDRSFRSDLLLLLVTVRYAFLPAGYSAERVQCLFTSTPGASSQASLGIGAQDSRQR